MHLAIRIFSGVWAFLVIPYVLPKITSFSDAEIATRTSYWFLGVFCMWFVQPRVSAPNKEPSG